MNNHQHWFFRHALGPLSALILCGFVELLTIYGAPWYTPSLALPVAALALSAWYGGLRANLASAAIISLYTFSVHDLSRSLQISFMAFVMAVPVGMIKRQFYKNIMEQHRASDTIDANIVRLTNTLNIISDALVAKSVHQPAADLRKVMEVVRDRLANQLTLNRSYHLMALERGFVIESGVNLPAELAYSLALVTPEQLDQALGQAAARDDGLTILKKLRAALGRIEAEIADEAEK